MSRGARERGVNLVMDRSIEITWMLFCMEVEVATVYILRILTAGTSDTLAVLVSGCREPTTDSRNSDSS